MLFADIKSSLELLADRDPEEARRIIDPVLAQMMDAVHRYEGTVNQVLGDGIMALFGAPLAHEDHAVRACYAALAMQGTLQRYSEELHRSYGINVRVRIGLNSGEVVVRAIGNDLHMEYSAIGQTTHLAARMEQLASPGGIWLTADTLRLAEGVVRVAPLGSHPRQGRTGAGGDLRPGDGREPTHPDAGRGCARTYSVRRPPGRVGSARGGAQARRSGPRRGAGAGGGAGSGEIPRGVEFTHSHRTQGCLVLESGSVSYGKATAYRPLIDLLKGYFRIEDSDDGRQIREKLTGKLLTLDKGLEPTLPAFLALLDVPVEDAAWQRLDPSQRRTRTLEASKRLLLRESEVQPLVLVFEDLHWIDSETQAFLDTLIDSLPAARILLLVNHRSEYQHEWATKTYYSHVRVDPLPAENAEKLLKVLVGDSPELAPFKRLLIERTEGNPFFLEEGVRSLAEANVLVGERGRYRLAMPLANIEVPPGVQAVLAARIDRLPPETKQLLQTAAVIGKDVPYSLIRAIAELRDEDLRSGLADLQAAEFLYETSLFPDPEYTFRHALTHEVAYASLLQERRRATHARVVEAMEALYGARLAEHVERLAHHAVRGEVWPKAIGYLRQAGVKALARSSNRQAAGYYEQGLAALQHLPGSPDAAEQTIDLHLELRNALHSIGEFERVLESLRKAESLAEALGDQQRLGRTYGFLAQSFRLMGDYARAIDAGQRAVTIARAFGDLRVDVAATYHLGQAHYGLGAYDRAIEHQRCNIERLRDEMAHEHLGMAGLPAVFSRGRLVEALVEQGRFREAVPVWEKAIRIADSAQHPLSQAFAEYCGGYLHLRKREPEQAADRLERGLALCRATNILLHLPFAAAFLGSAYALLGRLDEAIQLLEEALKTATSTQVMASRSCLLTLLGEGYVLGGRLADAGAVATQALTLARRSKEQGFEGWVLRSAGEVAAHREPPDVDGAAWSYGQALEIAGALGMRPLAAHCHLGLGRLYRRVEEAVGAERHVVCATTLLRDMEMESWLQRAESGLPGARD